MSESSCDLNKPLDYFSGGLTNTGEHLHTDVRELYTYTVDHVQM